MHRFQWKCAEIEVRGISHQLFKHLFITQLLVWMNMTVHCCVLHKILYIWLSMIVNDCLCRMCIVLSWDRVMTMLALLVTPSLISAHWLNSSDVNGGFDTHQVTHMLTLHRYECFLKYCFFSGFFVVHEASPHSPQGQIKVLECIYPRHSTEKKLGPHNKSQLYIFERLVCTF